VWPVANRTPKPLEFSVPKVAGQRNEDSFQYSSKGAYALSDGASISYDSATWSQILVRRFARTPVLSQEWLSAAIAEFVSRHDRENMPWMRQASFDRGSFASLLGIQFFKEGKDIQIIAVGDSLAILSDGDEIRETFPYLAPEQFEQSPRLLSTNPAENAFLADIETVDGFHRDWSYRGLSHPSLLCVTDALGHWILSMHQRGDSPIAQLRKLTDRKSFNTFVQAERAAGRMKRDDTTLIAFW
jgi:hypothetical protein